MSSLFGLFGKADGNTNFEIVKKALEEFNKRNPGDTNIWNNNYIAFGLHQVNDCSSDKSQGPYYFEQADCCIISDARIDYREELVKNIGDSKISISVIPDNQLVLKAYLKWGIECVKWLLGDFAFAIWDGRENRLFCARDHFGIRPLYYIETNQFFAFSSEKKMFSFVPEFSLEICEQSITDSLSTVYLAKGATPFKRVLSLRPAHSMVVEPDIISQPKRYWELKSNDENLLIKEEEAIQGIKERFLDSVKCRCRSQDIIGVELSGGLDSSSIACATSLLVRERNIRVQAYSQGMSEEQKKMYYPFTDESDYSKLIANHCQIDSHYILTGENEQGIFQVISDYLEMTISPINQGYALFLDNIFQKASSNGVRVILSGFGGDEGVTSHAAGFLGELASNRKYSLLKSQLKHESQIGGIKFQLVFFKYVILGIVPAIERLLNQLYSYRDFRHSRFKNFPIANQILKQRKIKKRYFQNVSLPRDNSVRARQHKRLTSSHIEFRIEETYAHARRWGIEYCYPLLDVKLVEYYFSLPSELKRRNGIKRYIFREAIKDIVPDFVRLRNDKSGATIPNALFRILENEEQFRDLINLGETFNKYHFVDYEKMHRILDLFANSRNGKGINFGPRFFINAISILILQQWQREGKIDIGIKC